MTRVGHASVRAASALHVTQASERRKSRHYFFNVPNWARKIGCPTDSNEALGTNYDRAVLRAEKILLPAFDSWRTGGEDADPVSVGVVVGTLDWMFHEYRQNVKSQKTAKRLQPLSSSLVNAGCTRPASR